MKTVLSLKNKIAKDDADQPDCCPRCFQPIDHRATRCNHCCVDIDRQQQVLVPFNNNRNNSNSSDNREAINRSSTNSYNNIPLPNVPPTMTIDDNDIPLTTNVEIKKGNNNVDVDVDDDDDQWTAAQTRHPHRHHHRRRAASRARKASIGLLSGN